MKLKMYSVFDAKISAYMRPFFLLTKGEATRSWIDIVTDDTTQFHKHPEDYTLFELGEWEDETGTFAEHVPHQVIGSALEFRSAHNAHQPKLAEERHAPQIT